MNQPAQQAFNIIELMITLTIISILVTIALPIYVQDYTIRSKISEGFLMGARLKTAIQETFQNNGPTDMTCNSEDTCAKVGSNYVATTKYLDKVESAPSGVIKIYYSQNVLPPSENVLAIAPAFPSGTAFDLQAGPAGTGFAWECGFASNTPGVPGAAAAFTTVKQKYLPTACRQ